MNTLLQWAKSIQGKSVDLDGAYGPQCMDVARSFLREVHPGVDLSGNAADVAQARLPGWTWIYNGPVNYPSAGALVVWKRNVTPLHIGEYGHIAVVLAACRNVLLTMDQNWGGKDYCTLVLHDYWGVSGWHNPPPKA